MTPLSRWRPVFLSFGTILAACTGVGIVETSDPLVKLDDAAVLFMRKDRPLPAEKLIQEAIGIYQQRGDAHGLGNAYREYADLLKSPAVSAWEASYRKAGGFLDRSITFDNRETKAAELYNRALAYYRRAVPELKATKQYDALTNTYFNMAWSYWRLGEIAEACAEYDHTIAAYQENMGLNPGANPYVGRGGGSLPVAVAAARKQAGC